MKLKQIVEGWRTVNKGNRTLLESILAPQVLDAVKDWIKAQVTDGCLIGGLALSYYVKPRFTQDIDILFLNASDIPTEVKGFKRTRPGAFQHNKTHVEVEVVTPTSINLSLELAQQVFNTANTIDGVKIASKSGIVALKLGRANHRDKDDIIQLILSGDVDISDFTLNQTEIDMFNSLVKESAHPRNLPNDTSII